MAPKSERRLRPWHGCLLVVVIVLIASILMVRGCTRTVMRWSVEYTETTPIVFQPPSGTDAEIERALEKANQLVTSLRSRVVPAPVDLSADELNLIVYYHPAAEKIAEHLRFAIRDDRLVLMSSLPMDKMAEAGMINVAGRYFNSEVTLDVSVVAGELMLYVHDVLIRGEKLPEPLIKSLSQENLGKEKSRPEISEMLSLIRNAYIKQGAVHIAP